MNASTHDRFGKGGRGGGRGVGGCVDVTNFSRRLLGRSGVEGGRGREYS